MSLLFLFYYFKF